MMDLFSRRYRTHSFGDLVLCEDEPEMDFWLCKVFDGAKIDIHMFQSWEDHVKRVYSLVQ